METTHIYLAVNVEYMGPHKGWGAVAALLVNGNHRKTIGIPLSGTTSYEAVGLGLITALGCLRQGGQRIVFHTRDKAFVGMVNNHLGKSHPSYIQNHCNIIRIIAEKQESVTGVWIENDFDPLFRIAREAAVRTKETAFPFIKIATLFQGNQGKPFLTVPPATAGETGYPWAIGNTGY